MDGQKSHHWSFTWRGYTAGDVERLGTIVREKCMFLIFGFKLDENGNGFLQGYAKFSILLRKATVLRILHCEPGQHHGLLVNEVSSIDVSSICTAIQGQTDRDSGAPDPWGRGYCDFTRGMPPSGATNWHDIMTFIEENPNFTMVRTAYPEVAIKHRKNIIGMIQDVLTCQAY